ncbi:hypothetical protein PN498_17850 [Oscillatoria sp. CS-180]|uniref:hypothetical protein n=1 Tax=Oscillatoria sp. CS-180 TaxID=3021720 RepID=UPI002330B73D|nr:hypothetical protein [Oscillatoria sp. CS-180]MDB9527864.1 hypothetical protein [Oscillatoria sp. CS-180]
MTPSALPPENSTQRRLLNSVNRLTIEVSDLERIDEGTSDRTNEIAADVIDITTAYIKLAIKVLEPVS